MIFFSGFLSSYWLIHNSHLSSKSGTKEVGRLVWFTDCCEIMWFIHICFMSVEMERVIGFASVDLSPLLWGFQSVCGWYNITDFNGQCHGQLKVSITPLKCVQELRGQRKPVNEENTKKSSVSVFSLLLSIFFTFSTG